MRLLTRYLAVAAFVAVAYAGQTLEQPESHTFFATAESQDDSHWG